MREFNTLARDRTHGKLPHSLIALVGSGDADVSA
jgi:hypothetical protein